jgi:hypothetical protein
MLLMSGASCAAASPLSLLSSALSLSLSLASLSLSLEDREASKQR